MRRLKVREGSVGKGLALMAAFVLHTAVSWAEPAKWVLQLDEDNAYYGASTIPKKEGSQNLQYFTFGYLADDYGLSMLGGRADTSYIWNDPANRDDFHLSALLDTTLSGYLILPKAAGYTVRMGVDANLPTGHASFGNRELAALMLDNVSQDLLPITSFGRGTNIAPNIAASKPFGAVTFGLGTRYQFNGAYNPDSEQQNVTYRPGDSLTVFGSMQYLLHGERSLLLDLSSTMSARDRQGGQEVFKLGNMYFASARWLASGEGSHAVYGLTYGWQENNQSFGTGGMTTEDRNYNNNLIEATANGSISPSRRSALNWLIGYKNVFRNGYDQSNALYDGGYKKLYLGGGASWKVSEKMTVNADLRLFELWLDGDTLEPTGAVYRGYNLDIGFVYTWGGAN